MGEKILADRLPLEQLRALQNLRKEWFWTTDASGRFNYFSPSYELITGNSPPLGKSRRELASDRGELESSYAASGSVAQILRAHETRAPFRELRYLSRADNGRQLELASSGIPQYDADGNFLGFAGVTADVTDTRPPQAEQGLDLSTVALLRTVLDTVPFSISVRDRSGCFRMVNRAFCSFYGIAESELIGRHIDGVREQLRIANEHVGMLAPETSMLDGHLAESTGEGRRRDRHGDLRTVQATRRPYRDASGKIAGIVTVAVDVSEQRKVEQELERHRAFLEELVAQRTAQLKDAQQSLLRGERLAAIGQLTATVGHELRNPLGTIGTSVAVLRTHRDALDERASRALARIDRNIRRCDKIIEQLLSYTRVPPENTREHVLFDQWLESVLGEYEWPAGIRHEVDFGATVAVDVDPIRLSQALNNLLDNACHAAQENVSGSESGIVHLLTRTQGARLEIVVSDNGPGIPPEDRETVFEPLFSTKAFGVGLGLALVRQIALEHRGGVEIGNAEGGGAEVSLWLTHDPDG